MFQQTEKKTIEKKSQYVDGVAALDAIFYFKRDKLFLNVNLNCVSPMFNQF